ncbi:unnamed protein product (macronuclear) [Paramecium tetraurelia]|uniref:Uncharacterized protein n=1 Tax=Paramecium tetraurelia TaxID=5888 RepID=A0C9L7_PARTE|nr:uncharacterized protein GSPATT00006790001 [Paramecium tetraurelia]CAK67484.1 unnamed protein product [Paramecium tetraurelia]|eukprot:XP_001434881.1 hypothetical protein (macronuclear) [Paramecium tetraurelia strain d4-2]
MSQSQNSQISLSPQKKQQQYFPTICLKTTESPQKGSITNTNYLFSQHLQNKVNNRKVKRNKELQLEQAYSIRKYLQVNSFAQGDSNMSHSKISQHISITEQKDTNVDTKYSISPLRQLSKIEETLSVKKLFDINHTQPEINTKHKSQGSTHNNCILELDQGLEEGDQKNSLRVQDQLIISPILQNNFKEISENAQSKSQSPNKLNVNKIAIFQIVLKFNQQNKEYKKYASQMIRMIRNTQQTLMKEFDQDQLEFDREFKLKKLQRQKERKDILQTAQEGTKNRQLKSMLMALKGSQDKIISDCPLFLSLGKKLSSQNSQTTIQSRKLSHQKNYQHIPFDKQFDDKNFRKHSVKSEICSLETSLELPLQIQRLM